MSRTTGIFEKLAEAQKESKKIDCIKDDLETLKSDTSKFFFKCNDLENKFSMVNDILNTKAKHEDLQAVNLKLHNQFDELKKSLNLSEEIKKNIEDLKKSFVDVNEYGKDIDNIQLCLEKYVLNGEKIDNTQDKKIEELEKRIKKLEEQNVNKNTTPTPRVPINQIRTAKST